MQTWRVLVVDGDERKRSETADLLSKHTNLAVETASSLADAIRIVEVEEPAAVVTGSDLGDGSGLELAERIRERSPGTACILYTTADSVETESFEETVVDFVPKGAPDATDLLVGLVEETVFEGTQAAHPVPDDEAERVAAAQELVSSGRLRESFERISRLAADHFGTDSAAVTAILRDEQVVLGRVGSVEIPKLREESLSTHALITDEPTLAVEETLADPRFVDMDAIQEAGIASYLGSTIHDPDGTPVAVLSVYDENPREFTDEDEQYLGVLADIAEDVLASSREGESR